MSGSPIGYILKFNDTGLCKKIVFLSFVCKAVLSTLVN